MSEEAISQKLGDYETKTWQILDRESFCVARAVGKLAQIAHFTCQDKISFKIIRCCYRTISRKELEDLLFFNDSPSSAPTVIQIFFWDDYGREPFYRPKLFFNQPKQVLPIELQKLVK